jgi:hypothetical protein
MCTPVTPTHILLVNIAPCSVNTTTTDNLYALKKIQAAQSVVVSAVE